MLTLYEIASFVLLAAEGGAEGGGGDGAGGDAAGKAAEKGAADGGGLFGGSCITFLPFLLIGVLFYFMMIVPQKREQRKMREMIANLKKSDRVVTAGGILGTVVNIQKDYVTLKIDDSSNAKMRVLRSSISRIVTDEDGDKKEDEVKKKDVE